MLKTYKAVYQYGYAIFGIGETEQEAINDAKEFADNSKDWWTDIDYNSKIIGEMILINISEPLYNKVLEFGGHIKIEKDSDGIYKLLDEIEEEEI